MFLARLNKNSNKIVKAENIFDENKIVYCLNPECNAEFKLRSHHGSRRQHFYQFPGSKNHIENCFYKNDENENYHKDNVEAFNVEDIFNKTVLTKDSSSTKRNTGKRSNPTTYAEKQLKTVINSSKALLKFCCGNSIETSINDTMSINDIYIDYRNVSNYIQGFDGLKMVNGFTYRFSKDNKSIHFTVKHKTSQIWLNALIYLPSEIYKECISFIYTNNNNKFSGFPIAVLASWDKVKEFNIQTNIISKGQVIYK